MRHTRSSWILAWAGAAGLGVANGAGSEAIYADAVGDEAAHIISTDTLLALLGGYISLLRRRGPLRDRREALSAGAACAAMTGRVRVRLRPLGRRRVVVGRTRKRRR